MKPQLKQKAKLIEVVQKPYKVDGNEGISYKLRFLLEDSIWQVKSSLEQTESLKSLVGKTGDAIFEVWSNKENVTIQLANFEVK